jgi:hypothetical protein
MTNKHHPCHHEVKNEMFSLCELGGFEVPRRSTDNWTLDASLANKTLSSIVVIGVRFVSWMQWMDGWIEAKRRGK